MTEPRDLASIAGDLYGVDLDVFTAERNRRAAELRGADSARADSARADAGLADAALADAVAALPKPTASVWFVNQLVRAEPDAVAAALALGPGLRAAQAAFDREALRELGAQRRSALSDLADAVKRVAEQRGRPLSATVADDVEQTLRAAISDEGAAAAVRSGRLVKPLQSVGGEAVDLYGAVAAPGEELAAWGAAAQPRAAGRVGASSVTGKGDAAKDAARARAEKARAELAHARREADAARAERDSADRELMAAAERHARLIAERDDALAEVDRLEREVGDAERQRREAIRLRDRANRRAEGTERVVARAETRLEELGS